jgi:hypothetical protein
MYSQREIMLLELCHHHYHQLLRKACLIDCYLRDFDIYVHESCYLGVQRHLPTYMKRRKRQDGPETYMQQIWYLISVTPTSTSESSSESFISKASFSP